MSEAIVFSPTVFSSMDVLRWTITETSDLGGSQIADSLDTLSVHLDDQASVIITIFADDDVTVHVGEDHNIQRQNTRRKRTSDWFIEDEKTYFSGYNGQTRRRRRDGS
jgi:hypothetical protein